MFLSLSQPLSIFIFFSPCPVEGQCKNSLGEQLAKVNPPHQQGEAQKLFHFADSTHHPHPLAKNSPVHNLIPSCLLEVTSAEVN